MSTGDSGWGWAGLYVALWGEYTCEEFGSAKVDLKYLYWMIDRIPQGRPSHVPLALHLWPPNRESLRGICCEASPVSFVAPRAARWATYSDVILLPAQGRAHSPRPFQLKGAVRFRILRPRPSRGRSSAAFHRLPRLSDPSPAGVMTGLCSLLFYDLHLTHSVASPQTA